MSYTPPPGYKVGLEFNQPYELPLGYKVGLEFNFAAVPPGTIAPSGFVATLWGNAAFVGSRYITPAGFTSEAFGTTFLELANRTYSVAGWFHEVVGQPLIKNFNQELYAAGIPPPPLTGTPGEREVPPPIIWYRNRIVAPLSLPRTDALGALTVTQFVRYVDQAGAGYFGEAVPQPVVNYKHREIFPIGAISLVFGTTTVKRRFFVEPVGWDSQDISDNHELLINTRRLYVLNSELDPTLWGATTVFNYRQDISLHNYGFYDTQWSFPIVYNLKKEVFVGPFNDNLNPDEWPNYLPYVENKDRYVRTFGHQSSRFNLATWIYNKAVPVKPVGTEMTLWGADTFISHRIRNVYPQGWDSFYNTQYSVVYNTADVLAPVSLGVTDKFGRPDPVLNLNREVKQHSGWEGPLWGTPFVAFGIRYITPGLFYDVPAAFPEVRLNPYPIAPVGIPWQGQVGGHEVRIFLRQVFPYAVNVHSTEWVGEPAVRNRNITVYPYAYEQTTFGVQHIQNFIRYLTLTGFGGELLGAHLIEYRTRTVPVHGVSAPSISQLHRIRNDSPDPPSNRTITLAKYGLDGEVVDGDGIPPPSVPYVPHQVRLMTFWPLGWESSRFGGNLKVYSTAIVPAFWQSDGGFGVPFIIFTRYIAVPSLEGIISQVPEPALSPHHIYGPQGDAKPPNYHPQGGGFLIDEFLSSWDGSQWPWFGQTTVALKNRIIGPVPLHDGGLQGFTAWGDARFENRRKYVYPDGIRSLRMGFAVLWGVPQYVNLDEDTNHQGIAPSTQWGFNLIEHYVDPHGPQNVGAFGLDATFWGDTRVELFNREVAPVGIPHSGNPQQGYTSPWGDALVGFPRRYQIGMGVQTLWGTHVIEYKNRQVWPEGFLSCTLEVFNFEDFMFPMKVSLKNPSRFAPSILSTLAFGLHVVSHGNRVVYGRGIDSYNTGAHGIVAATTIIVTGWDSAEYGDIDRWEAGTIKAHGDDLSTMGYPRILNPLRQTSWEEYLSGVHRVASGVAPIGIPDIAFDGPSVTNPFGCTNRVTTPLPVLSTQVVGTPTIGAV